MTTAASIARSTKDIFTYALNISSVREGHFSQNAQYVVNSLSIKFVDAIDESSNDPRSFYAAMRSEIRRVLTVIAAETCVDRDQDTAFFLFERVLENTTVADEDFYVSVRIIRDTMEAYDRELMASA